MAAAVAISVVVRNKPSWRSGWMMRSGTTVGRSTAVVLSTWIALARAAGAVQRYSPGWYGSWMARMDATPNWQNIRIDRATPRVVMRTIVPPWMGPALGWWLTRLSFG